MFHLDEKRFNNISNLLSQEESDPVSDILSGVREKVFSQPQEQKLRSQFPKPADISQTEVGKGISSFFEKAPKMSDAVFRILEKIDPGYYAQKGIEKVTDPETLIHKVGAPLIGLGVSFAVPGPGGEKARSEDVIKGLEKYLDSINIPDVGIGGQNYFNRLIDKVKGNKKLSPVDIEDIEKATGLTRVPKQKKDIYQGEKDLTTKFLEYAKGKTTLSRQEITDFAKRPELKKGEADLLSRLGSEVKETKVPAQEFADSIRRDLLELKPVKVQSPQYGNVNIEREIPDYQQYGMDADAMAKAKLKGRNYEEVVFESPITTNGSSHYPNSKNYFAHARGDEVVEGGKKIWREQEIQSDLLQKDSLNRNTFGYEAKRFEEGGRQMISTIKNPMAEIRPGQVDEVSKAIIETQAKLEPFTNDRFGERIMRERIKEKASKGYAKYRLPTGETIGKIEGFENAAQYRRYSDWGKFLKNKFGGKEVIDPQGNSWMEIDLRKEMGKLPIEAFGIVPLYENFKQSLTGEEND